MQTPYLLSILCLLCSLLSLNAFSTLESTSFLAAVSTFLPKGNEFELYAQTAIENELERLKKTPETATFVACASQSISKAVANDLSTISSGTVGTIYASKSNDRTCFLLSAHFDSIQQLPPFIKIAPIPPTLKFSQGLFNVDVSGVEELSRKAIVTEHVLHDHAALSIYTHDGSHPHEDILNIASINVRNRNLDELTNHFTQSHEASLSWRTFFENSKKMSAKKQSCDMSNIRLSSVRGKHFNVNGLRSMHESNEHYTTCLIHFALQLSIDPRVTHITFKPKHTLRNGAANWITQSGIQSKTPIYNFGLTGLGEIVGVADTGLDERSCYFYDYSKGDVVARSINYTDATYDHSRRKVIQYIEYVDGYDEAYGHGSHVCGSIAGNIYDSYSGGDIDLTYYDGSSVSIVDTYSGTINNGIAYDAKLAFFDIGKSNGSLETPDDLSIEMLAPAYEAGARIHSNSWGTAYNGYLFDDIYIDEFTYTYSDMVVLFAAGNDGSSGYNTVGSPAVSKNAVSVGASESGSTRYTTSINYMASFSSRGPTYDDRFKPDVSAPGYFVASSQSIGYYNETSCNMTLMAGTSMATPVTAGNTALIRQYFRTGMYADYVQSLSNASCSIYPCEAFNATGALLKAMLVSSARGIALYSTDDSASDDGIDLSTPPDNLQGFGRIQLNRVIGNASESKGLVFVYEGSLTSGEYMNFTVETVLDGIDFEATLVWMDPPNSILASQQVLNDLDITTTLPSGEVIYANSGSATDEINNVEKIIISNSSFSSNEQFIVTVSAGYIYEADNQSFALVISGPGTVSNASIGNISVTNSSIEYDCYDFFDVLGGDGFCDYLIGQGYTCASFFCSSCSYADYCELSCGYCSTSSPTLSPTPVPTTPVPTTPAPTSSPTTPAPTPTTTPAPTSGAISYSIQTSWILLFSLAIFFIFS